jgi:mRNA interferase RelE/StbE
MYQVLIGRQAQKQLEKIPDPDFSRIKDSINNLAENPRPHGCKKLKGRNGYRIRQGNYRIIYDIYDQVLTVVVLDTGHRKDIYQ